MCRVFTTEAGTRASAIYVSAVIITDSVKETLTECYFWDLKKKKKYHLLPALESSVCHNMMLQDLGTDCVCAPV